MKHKLKNGDRQSLNAMVTTPNNRGRRTVLSEEEEDMVKERIKVAAVRGFAIDYNGIRSVMSRIAADRRSGWKNGIPCYDTIRAFRARHRDITCWKTESKEHVKLKAENYAHVELFFSALESVEKLHPGILSNPTCVCNMDETALKAIEGNKTKVFSGCDTSHGGFRGTSTSYGLTKHVTAVVAVSASGLKAAPFFIVAGKKLSSRWLEPVRGSFKTRVSGICSRFTQPNWFPLNGVIKLTENGSMEIPAMTAFVKHIDNYVRQFCPDKTYLLGLDGYSSRKCVEWIEECLENNCEAVVSPANNSHFLQACDQTVNKRFQEALKELKDEFCKFGTVDTKQINFNLACGVYAYDKINASDIINSFNVTGLFPFDRGFPLQFQTEKEKTERKAEEQWSRVEHAGSGSRLKSVLLRKSDKDTLGEVQKVLETKMDACRHIQQLSILLKNAETSNNILMAAGSGRSGECSTARSENVHKANMLDAGAPAEWVTVEEVLRRRKEKEAEELRLRVSKEQDKVRRATERVERLDRKALERDHKAQERERNKIAKAAAKEVEKRQKLASAAHKEREMQLKKVAVENAKVRARKAKEEAISLSRMAATVWRLQNPEAKRRSRKRDVNGTEKVVPLTRTFQFAASLVVEAVEAPMPSAIDTRGVQY